MKIWYQSFTRQDRFKRYGAALDEIVHGAVPPGVILDVHCVPRDAGYNDHQYRFYEFVDTRDVVSNAVRAQEQGFSAYLIGNILDPGLHYARELVDIPVLGLCDTAIAVACQMGRTFGFVTINEQQSYRLHINVRDTGMTGRFSGSETLGIDNYPAIDDSYEGDAMTAFVREFSGQVEELSRRGAEVVIPGGGVVMALVAKAGLTRVGSVPVVNGLHALASYGCVAASLYEQNGHFTSKRLAYAGPPAEALREIRRTAAADLLQAPLGVPARM